MRPSVRTSVVALMLVFVGGAAAAASGCTASEGTGEAPPAEDASTDGAAPDATTNDGGETDAAGGDAFGSDATPSDGASGDAAGDAADADAASSLVDFTAQPSTGYAGLPIKAVSVRVRDTQGNVVTTPTPVTLSLAATSGTGVLGGTLTVMTDNGIAKFTDLTISKSGVYHLVASAVGDTANSQDIAVDAWQPWNGPLVGGSVRRIVVDPTNADRAFAGTDYGGIYRTTDGSTWMQVGLFGASPRGIAIDPTNPQVIYAGNDASGVYKSSDGGDTWVPANAGYADKVANAIAVDPTNGQIVYWATNNVGLLKSTNGGTSWSPANDAAFAAKGLNAVAIAPSNTQTLYVQSYNQQVYKSTDGGGTWAPMSGLPASAATSCIVVDPTDASTVYVGLGSTGGGGIYKSTGGGAFIKLAADAGTLASLDVEGIVIDPAAPQHVTIAAYGSDVFQSKNGGQSWASLGDTLHGTNTMIALGMSPSAPGTFYVGHYIMGGGGISKSIDDGATWNDDSTGLHAFDVPGIAIDGTGALWVGGGYIGLYKSTDGGDTYTQFGTKSGLDWGGDFVIQVSPQVTTTVYVGVNGGGIFKTTNGTSFVKDTVLGNVSVTSLSLSAADASTIYAAGYSAGVFSTSTGGSSWTKHTAPSYPWIYAGGIAGHPTVAGTAYVGIGDGLYQTTDYGVGWTKVVPSLPQARVAFDSAGNVYAAGASIQMSADGTTWTDLAPADAGVVPPLGSGANATTLAVYSIGGSNVVFVGAGNKGLWRRAGGTWTQSGHPDWHIVGMAQDPAHPTTLYAGLKGGGLVRSLSGGE